MSRIDVNAPGLLLTPAPPPLGPGSWFEPPVVIQATLAPHNLIQVGAFTGIYGGRVGHSRIGRYCSIAPGVDIASDQHPTDWLSSSMAQYVPNVHGWGDHLRACGFSVPDARPSFASNQVVTIGNDVWLGQGVFVKSGVRIGHGAIVAAHSVVVHDVPDYAIVAGVPARLVRMRFDEALVERMLRVAWRQYPIMTLPDVDFRDPHACLDRIEELVGLGTLTAYSPSPVTVG